MGRTRLARSCVLLAAAVLSAACANATVETERADSAVGPSPTVPGPPDAAPSPTSTTEPSVTTSPVDVESDVTPATDPTSSIGESEDDRPNQAAGETRDPELGVGDELFPETGSSDVDVQSYLVQVTIDPDRELMDGVVTVVADIVDEIDVLPLDQVGLDIASVQVDGADTTFETTETELLVQLPANSGSTVSVRVEYSFDPSGATSAVGLPAGWFENERSNDSYVLNEPAGARTWLPSNDHPSDKATWTFELSVPDGVTAAANGSLVTRATTDGVTTWVWSELEAMPTYLVQVIIGKYEVVVADPIVSTTGESIDLIHVVPAGERTTFDAAFESIDEQMRFFEERFGPYPFERYGLAFVNDLSGLAMETQGRSMFGADDFASGELTFLAELLLSHELGHQWFGNAVSPATWSDLWLNESFATYAEWLWLDEIELQPLDAQVELMLERRQQGGESTGVPSVSELFGFLRYEGGAPIVHALRLTLGDDAFFALLSSWTADNFGTSQTTATFIDLAEDFHGEDLTVFFDEWLFAGDLPDTYPV